MSYLHINNYCKSDHEICSYIFLVVTIAGKNVCVSVIHRRFNVFMYSSDQQPFCHLIFLSIISLPIYFLGLNEPNATLVLIS